MIQYIQTQTDEPNNSICIWSWTWEMKNKILCVVDYRQISFNNHDYK